MLFPSVLVVVKMTMFFDSIVVSTILVVDSITSVIMSKGVDLITEYVACWPIETSHCSYATTIKFSISSNSSLYSELS